MKPNKQTHFECPDCNGTKKDQEFGADCLTCNGEGKIKVADLETPKKK